MLIKTDGDKTNMYKFTNVLGTWIRNKYNGVFVLIRLMAYCFGSSI